MRCFHSYASRIGSKMFKTEIDDIFASFHSYASRIGSKRKRAYVKNESVIFVSIHTLHELEARIRKRSRKDWKIWGFPFIRFTNWKQEYLRQLVWRRKKVSIHTLHELEASVTGGGTLEVRALLVSIHTLHELEARSPAQTDPGWGCQLRVSIHTLHELEARISRRAMRTGASYSFPFIRFTNWKQVVIDYLHTLMAISRFHSYASRIGSKPADEVRLELVKHGVVSIHTLHELEARYSPSRVKHVGE